MTGGGEPGGGNWFFEQCCTKNNFRSRLEDFAAEEDLSTSLEMTKVPEAFRASFFCIFSGEWVT